MVEKIYKNARQIILQVIYRLVIMLALFAYIGSGVLVFACNEDAGYQIYGYFGVIAAILITFRAAELRTILAELKTETDKV